MRIEIEIPEYWRIYTYIYTYTSSYVDQQI